MDHSKTDQKPFRVLVVGAGGIGCELLKDLVLAGFRDLEVIDLDTIDVSNLNRQFLFDAQSVGKPKASVAAEKMRKLRSNVKIVAHHCNVKDKQFDIDYFSGFNVVLNALDNIDARRHVNRMILAVDVPLIDAGTGGYTGQVQSIVKGKTECFECTPRVPPKEYAYCTVHSHPTLPVHAVVWARELFVREFGTGKPYPSASACSKSDELFDLEFRERIVELIEMQPLWRDGANRPEPLILKDVLSADRKRTEGTDGSSDVPESQRVWSASEAAVKFIASCSSLYEKRPLTFDKDDPLMMRFVAAGSLLRCSVFHLPLLSEFASMDLAGNIVPAIATTNAIIAGLATLEVMRIARGEISSCRTTILVRPRLPATSTRKKRVPFVISSRPSPAKNSCVVCGSPETIICHLLSENMKFSDFLEGVLKKGLGLMEPTVVAGSRMIYECGDGLDESEVTQYADVLAKTLSDLRIGFGSILTLEEFSQQITFTLSISRVAKKPDEFEVADGEFRAAIDTADAKWFELVFPKSKPNAVGFARAKSVESTSEAVEKPEQMRQKRSRTPEGSDRKKRAVLTIQDDSDVEFIS